MTNYNLEHRFLGREIATDNASDVVGYVFLVSLRVLMGWTLFQDGIVKILDPEWTAGFLQFANSPSLKATHLSTF